jgi:hypothetical protein
LLLWLCSLEEYFRELVHDRGHAMSFRLLCKQALRLVSVALALAVLLVRILHRDLLVHHILAVHVLDGIVRSLKVGVRHESIALGQHVLVPRDLGGTRELAEADEGVVQRPLVYHLVQVSDEELGANFNGLLLVGRGLVHSDLAPVQASPVEYVDCIIGVLLGCEFDEAKALVLAVYAVDGHVESSHATMVVHELGEQLLGDIFVDVADVDGGFLVLFPVVTVRPFASV